MANRKTFSHANKRYEIHSNIQRGTRMSTINFWIVLVRTVHQLSHQYQTIAMLTTYSWMENAFSMQTKLVNIKFCCDWRLHHSICLCIMHRLDCSLCVCARVRICLINYARLEPYSCLFVYLHLVCTVSNDSNTNRLSGTGTSEWYFIEFLQFEQCMAHTKMNWNQSIYYFFFNHRNPICQCKITPVRFDGDFHSCPTETTVKKKNTQALCWKIFIVDFYLYFDQMKIIEFYRIVWKSSIYTTGFINNLRTFVVGFSSNISQNVEFL